MINKIIVVFIMIVYVFLFTGCSLNELTNNRVQWDSCLSNGEIKDILSIDENEKASYPSYELYEVIDKTKQFPQKFSLYMVTLKVKYFACLYIEEDYYKPDITFGDYIQIYNKCKWVTYNNDNLIEQKINGKNLVKTYLAYDMTIETDLLSNDTINRSLLYYEFYHMNDEQKNLKPGYYLLFESKNIFDSAIKFSNFINFRRLTRNGSAFELLYEDLKYYLHFPNVISKQTLDGKIISQENFFEIYSGDYYKIIEPYLIDAPGFTIDYKYSENIYNYTCVKLELNILIDIVGGELG